MQVPVTMHKAEKYAIRMSRMDEATRTFFLRNFGCARKVYNLYVDHLYEKLEAAGYSGGEPLPEIKLPEVTAFKREYPYLKDADSLGLANAKIAFSAAMKRYNEEYDHVSYTKRAKRRADSGSEPLSFRGLKGMPKFHSKAHGDFSYTTNCQYPAPGKMLSSPTVRLEGKKLHLPKLKQDVELVMHRSLPEGAVIGNVTVSMDPAGRMYASIGYSYTAMMDMVIREAAAAGDESIKEKLTFLGLDYSQNSFYVDSEGRKTNYPHCYRAIEGDLARAQRKLSRMERGSANYNRQLRKVQELHAKAANARKDFIEKESTYLSQVYDVVCVEDLDLRAMGECLSLGKNLHDNGFGMFRTRLAQKLEAKGSVLVKVGRWYPSTKTCSCCGYVNSAVTLGVDEWTCPDCGTHHDRDRNAAVNIREEGKRIFLTYFAEWLAEDEKSRSRAEALSAARKQKKAS